MLNLFTYGSLMCDDIMDKVAGCHADRRQATLKDYFRAKIRGEEYPGIVARQGTEVKGVVYLDLPAEAIARLDTFEGKLYVRREVSVITDADSPRQAMAYVIKPRYQHLLTAEEWSFAYFLAVGKSQFEQAYSGFRRI
jgi:gamma-glutamylcyclotransferase (GGCT)/AIG2-like uncharacterized protein YtfP